MEFSNDYKQQIAELLPPEFARNLNHSGITKTLDVLKGSVSDSILLNIDYELNMAAIGAKMFIYLPAELENTALLPPEYTEGVYLDFLDRVIFPQAAEYLAYLIEFLQTGEGPKELNSQLGDDNIEITNKIKEITGDIPVPAPPKFVSPKLNPEQSRIEQIRPKPHQGDHDPYREPTD